MKKIMAIALGIIFCLAATLTSFAIELPMKAVEEKKVTGNYAKVKDGKIVFGKQPTAYSPDVLNMILNAYGVSLAADAVSAVQAASKAYASLNKEGQVVFGKQGTAYSPETLHTILTAYGNESGKLSLSTEAARALNDPPNYVKVNKDGKLVFGKQPTAYSPDEFNMLLSRYQLPRGEGKGDENKLEPGPGPATEPEPGRPVEPGEREPAKGPCSDKDGDGVCDENDDCPDTPKGAFVNARGCWVVENLLFDFDKAIIKSKYYKDLDEVVRVLKDNPYLNVEIQGHTCNIGTDRYNQRLSERRAKAVKDYFMKKGIPKERLSSIGYGEKKPAFSNQTKDGRRQNRRVELKPIR
jgi:OOP family OmpA-OmpF porin